MLRRQAPAGVAANEAPRPSVDNGSRLVVLDEKLRPPLE